MIKTLLDLLRERGDSHPDKICFRYLHSGSPEGRTDEWSFAELDRRARAVALRLARERSPGDRVLLLFGPGLDFIAAFFGCIYARCIAVPIYPPDPRRLAQTLPRMAAIAMNASASAVATTRDVLMTKAMVESVAPDLRGLSWISVDDLDGEDAELWRPPAVGEGDVAFLQYTSGSTGAPKGVVLSHANILANQRALGAALDIGYEREVGVSWMPLFHDSGLLGATLPSLLAAATTTMLSPLTFLKQPLTWLRAISRYRGTICGSPDFGFARCARLATPEDVAALDLSSWRVAMNAAEPVRVETMDRFAAVFEPAGFRRRAFTPGYGLAEATLLVTTKPPGSEPVHCRVDREALERGVATPTDDADGRALVSSGVEQGYALRIVDPERLVELPAGTVGEIWVRGPGVSRGYWQLDDESERAFGRSLAGEAGYLRTGDLGFMLAGELYVTGRCKDLIIVRGRNIYPQDLERCAEAASPSLRPGCSAAFSIDDGGQERVILVAEVNDAAAERGEVYEQVRRRVLASFQILVDEIVLLPPRAILKTSSGKIQRRACCAAYRAEQLPALELDPRVAARTRAPASSAPAAAGEAILAVIHAKLGEVEPALASGDWQHSSAAELGLDSAGAAELARLLERELGREVPVELFFGHTLAEVAALLTSTATPAAANIEAPNLAAELRPRTAAVAQRRETVLLTGATGFLGRHLLAALLDSRRCDVIALVRADTGAEGLARISDALAQIGRAPLADDLRLRAVPGDLGQPRLGLAPDLFAALAERVTAIVHCGARVHWLEPYAMLAPVNVDAVAEIIALAGASGAAIHHISSLGVVALDAEAGREIEEGYLPPLEHLRLGYFQTKWAAEQLLVEARARGFDVSIYRPGIIAGDSRDGLDVDAPNQLFFAFLRGIVELGAGPQLDKVIDVVPVDYVARAVVALLGDGDALGHTFHLTNPRPMRQLELYAQLRRRGYTLDEQPYPTWRRRVLELPERAPDSALARFAPYYAAMTPARMQALAAVSAERLPVRTDNLARFLDPSVRCPPFDEALLDVYLRSYAARGLLPAPAPSPARASVSASFAESYARADAAVDSLYARAKLRQWDAAERIDWSVELDPESPISMPDSGLLLFGSDIWDRLTARERASLRQHAHAWQISQQLHGEQGALLGACRLAELAPTIEAKLFAATQVFDEARHVEVFSRLLDDKLEVSYPITPPLRALFDDILGERRWDMVSLGMQVLLEGLALATFALVRKESKNPLVRAIHAYVMEDEARHVAFGRITLGKFYAELSERERDEREEFVVEASYALRDRFDDAEVYERLGLPVAACRRHLHESGALRNYRSQLFSRIVPVIQAIGLMGPRVRRAYGEMGVLGFAKLDLDAIAREDEAIAKQFDMSEVSA